MKKALLSTNELRGPTNTEGYRVVEVVDTEFEVNPTNLMWVDCDDSIVPDKYYYRTSDSTFKKLPTGDIDKSLLTKDPETKEFTNEFQWNWETEQYDIVNIA